MFSDLTSTETWLKTKEAQETTEKQSKAPVFREDEENYCFNNEFVKLVFITIFTMLLMRK